MMIEVLKSKIHNATVTETELYYNGSITIDEEILDAVQLIEHEKVSILNINNGERFETYIIKGKRKSGVICLNGPAARRTCIGDKIIIISYCQITIEEAKKRQPNIVFLEENNNIKNCL